MINHSKTIGQFSSIVTTACVASVMTGTAWAGDPPNPGVNDLS